MSDGEGWRRRRGEAVAEVVEAAALIRRRMNRIEWIQERERKRGCFCSRLCSLRLPRLSECRSGVVGAALQLKELNCHRRRIRSLVGWLVAIPSLVTAIASRMVCLFHLSLSLLRCSGVG